MDQSQQQPSSERAPLERDIQNFLERNPSALGEPLTIIGKEYPVPFGRIDLLATDANENIVVIELKLGVASRDAIGQLQSYMGSIQSSHPDKFVRGILVAAGLDQGADAALRVARDIDFTAYAISFNFKACKSSESTYNNWLISKSSADKKVEGIWLPPNFKK